MSNPALPLTDPRFITLSLANAQWAAKFLEQWLCEQEKIGLPSDLDAGQNALDELRKGINRATSKSLNFTGSGHFTGC